MTLFNSLNFPEPVSSSEKKRGGEIKWKSNCGEAKGQVDRGV